MPDPAVIVVRHAETAWSRSGQHTSRTELDLTPEGERQAAGIGAALAGIPFDLVLCSPRLRARHTAELAGLEPIKIDDDLAEWDYGDFEGLTTSEIQARCPGWSVWDGPWSGGETAAEVAARADRVVDALLRSGANRIAVVAMATSAGCWRRAGWARTWRWPAGCCSTPPRGASWAGSGGSGCWATGMWRRRRVRRVRRAQGWSDLAVVRVSPTGLAAGCRLSAGPPAAAAPRLQPRAPVGAPAPLGRRRPSHFVMQPILY